MTLILNAALLVLVAVLAHRLRDVRRRLTAVELRLATDLDRTGRAAAAVEAMPPPLPFDAERDAAPSGDAVSVPPWTGPSEPPPLPRRPAAPLDARAGSATAGRPSLELRFGRRWAALLGGSAVAFGVALLVGHSIQQGWFPPEARLAGAALLSLCLCGAAERFRRRGTFAVPDEAGPMRRAADIPSVLLGTGLAGIFAVAYGAHAVYGFVGAPAAFAVMAAAACGGIAAALVYGPALAWLGYLAAQAVPLLVGGDSALAGAAYVALVGAAGYAAAYRGRWRELENPAGSILLLLAGLLSVERVEALACVALPAGATALAVTALRLRPRAAWRSRRPSLDAAIAVALAGGHGYLLATHVARASTVAVFQPVATAAGFALLLAAFAVAATIVRARLAAPLVAALVAAALAWLADASAAGWIGDRLLVGLGPDAVMAVFTAVSTAVIAVAAAATRWTGVRSPLTAVIGTGCAGALLVAADLGLDASGALSPASVGTLALAGGAALLAVGRPGHAAGTTGRAFPAVVAASFGLALLCLAAASSGLVDGPRATLLGAAAAAGLAAFAVVWRAPLFALAGGAAALLVIAHAGWETAWSVLAPRGGGDPSLGPVLLTTLAPGLVLLGMFALLRRRIGDAAVREADRRWLALVGAAPIGRDTGMPASLVAASAAAGALLFAAGVATIRFGAFGDAYAPISSPADLGLAAAILLSGAIVLRRAGTALGRDLPSAWRSFVALAALMLAAAIVANPFGTGAPVGDLPGLNLLVLAYLLPALLAWRLAREVAGSSTGAADERARGVAAGTALAGLLAYATCAVSQLFQGGVLTPEGVGEAELWTHTAVWLVLGVAILAYGIRAGAPVARLAALGIVAAVAVKVAVLDLSHLTGVARALSVIALGLVLLGIGMTYGRLARAARA